MSKVLGFTVSEIERIREARNSQGFLRRFVSAPFSVFHGVGGPSNNQSSFQDVDLAEAWVDYLNQNSNDSRGRESDTE